MPIGQRMYNVNDGQLVRIKDNPSRDGWVEEMNSLAGQERTVIYTQDRGERVAVKDMLTERIWWVYTYDLDGDFTNYATQVIDGVTVNVCADCTTPMVGTTLHYNPHGHPVCIPCFTTYGQCEHCGLHMRRSLLQTVRANGRAHICCEDCADSNYFTCDDCGELHQNHHMWARDDNNAICDDCSDNWNMCESCNAIMRSDEVFEMNNCYYCEHCYEERANRAIHEFNYKPTPIFMRTRYKADTNVKGYYGVENEIDRGNDKERTAKQLKTIGGDALYMKHDGSLDNGFEMVTTPCTLSYHMKKLPWKELCEVATSNGFKSHDVKTCGLHIHASRSLFGRDKKEQDLTIAKIMLLFDKFWEDKIVPFSRRDINRLDRWACKPNADIKHTDSDDMATNKVQQVDYRGRYQAINLQNRETVEFRIFKGTLKPETIIASIQWVDTLINFAVNKKLAELWSVSWVDIFGDTQYKELRGYLAHKNLLGGM